MQKFRDIYDTQFFIELSPHCDMHTTLNPILSLGNGTEIYDYFSFIANIFITRRILSQILQWMALLVKLRPAPIPCVSICLVGWLVWLSARIKTTQASESPNPRDIDIYVAAYFIPLTSLCGNSTGNRGQRMPVKPYTKSMFTLPSRTSSQHSYPEFSFSQQLSALQNQSRHFLRLNEEPPVCILLSFCPAPSLHCLLGPGPMIRLMATPRHVIQFSIYLLISSGY